MKAAPLALSSRSWHECDDRVERFNVVCDEMWVHTCHLRSWPKRSILNESEARCMKGHVSNESHVFEARYAHLRKHFNHRKTIPTDDLRTA